MSGSEPGADSLDSARVGISPRVFVFIEMQGLSRTHAHPVKFVLFVLAVLGLCVAAVDTVNQPATCGGQTMTAGSRCVNLKTGSSATAAQVANAPIQQWWFWAVVIGLVLAVGIWLIVIPTFRRDLGTLESNGRFASHLLDGLDHQIAATEGDPVQERLIEYRAAYLAKLQKLKGRKVPAEVVERYEDV